MVDRMTLLWQMGQRVKAEVEGEEEKKEEEEEEGRGGGEKNCAAFFFLLPLLLLLLCISLALMPFPCTFPALVGGVTSASLCFLLADCCVAVTASISSSCCDPSAI